ncbi:hypothetical protein POPTR_006G051400v4 [Populus trichocarpa]|uniref:Uncharacterized protein n=1 Tax=Populus trichocarpa TaxID=3694 RepID=A0ACC0SSD9_POPTR|nr:hypothetical protein POPTR_006G051400v4 [Populus trichocarpa]
MQFDANILNNGNSNAMQFDANLLNNGNSNAMRFDENILSNAMQFDENILSNGNSNVMQFDENILSNAMQFDANILSNAMQFDASILSHNGNSNAVQFDANILNNGNSNAYISPGSLVDDQFCSPNNAMVMACSSSNLINHSGQPQSQGSSRQVNVDDGDYIDPYFFTLPIGVRFCPNDRELVMEYLMKKVRNEALPKNRIHEVNIYEYHPAILTEKYKRYAEIHWSFFTTRDKKYPNGTRPSRAVPGGFWKPTGTSATCVFDENKNPIASKTPLDFYESKGKDGRTEWKMLEYFPKCMAIHSSSAGGMRLNDCVLCVIYRKGEKKSGAATANEET